MKIRVIAIVLACLASSVNTLAASNFGIKTGIALLYSLSDSTLIPIQDSAIVSMYNRVKGRLPLAGNFSELTEPALFGIVSLTGEFCRRFVDAEMLKTNMTDRLATKEINFTVGPTQISSGAATKMLGDFGNLFWGTRPTSAEATILMKFIEESAAILGDTGAATQDLVIATCVQYASSLNFLLVY